MSNTARAIAAVFAAHLVIRRRPDGPVWIAAVPAAVLWFPVLSAASAFVWLGMRRVRLHLAERRIEQRARDDVAALAELTALGLAAGLDFSASLLRASMPLSAEIRAEVVHVLRRARVAGLSAAHGSAGGRSRHFLRLSARAVDTGAPVRGAVEAFVDDAVAEEHTRRLVAVRRLPVKLLFPLALMILPGFMVLTVGPALVGSVRRLAV